MNCKNCDSELEAQDGYCKICGGKVIRQRLTIKNLFTHLSETFFNYDNKLFRTLKDIFTKPEEVIDGYVTGVRKRYIDPVSFFGFSLTLSGLSIFIMKKFYMDVLDFSEAFESSLNQNSASRQVSNNITDISFEYGSLLLTAAIPFLAVMSIIIFFDKRYNFTEHIIVYLYSMSAISIVSVISSHMVLLVIPEGYLIYALVLYVFMFLQNAFILKRLFKLSAGQLILRSFLFLILFFIVYVAFSILALLIMFATGALDLNDFAPK